MRRIFVTLSIILSLLLATASPAQAQDCANVAGVGTVCARLVNDEIVVTLLGTEVARLVAPVVQSTIRVQVPGPVVTVSGPTITVPGPVRTVPGPTRTIFIIRDGETITVTPSPTTRQNTQSRGTVTITPSLRPSPPAPSPRTVVVEKEKTVTISIPKAVGFSVGFVLLGILLALIALWVIYIVGYKEGEEGNKRFLLEFLRDLRRRD